MMKKTFTKLFVAFLALLLAPSGVWAKKTLQNGDYNYIASYQLAADGTATQVVYDGGGGDENRDKIFVYYKEIDDSHVAIVKTSLPGVSTNPLYNLNFIIPTTVSYKRNQNDAEETIFTVSQINTGAFSDDWENETDFYWRGWLANVTIPAGITLQSQAFQNVTRLQSVTFAAGYTESDCAADAFYNIVSGRFQETAKPVQLNCPSAWEVSENWKGGNWLPQLADDEFIATTVYNPNSGFQYNPTVRHLYRILEGTNVALVKILDKPDFYFQSSNSHQEFNNFKVDLASTVENNSTEYTVTKICAGAFTDIDWAYRITMPSGLTEIEDLAFVNISGLNTVSFKNVTAPFSTFNWTDDDVKFSNVYNSTDYPKMALIRSDSWGDDKPYDDWGAGNISIWGDANGHAIKVYRYGVYLDGTEINSKIDLTDVLGDGNVAFKVIGEQYYQLTLGGNLELQSIQNGVENDSETMELRVVIKNGSNVTVSSESPFTCYRNTMIGYHDANHEGNGTLSITSSEASTIQVAAGKDLAFGSDWRNCMPTIHLVNTNGNNCISTTDIAGTLTFQCAVVTMETTNVAAVAGFGEPTLEECVVEPGKDLFTDSEVTVLLNLEEGSVFRSGVFEFQVAETETPRTAKIRTITPPATGEEAIDLVIPSSVEVPYDHTYAITGIEQYCMKGSIANPITTIKSITIPSTVTAIGDNAFACISNLESVTFDYPADSDKPDEESFSEYSFGLGYIASNDDVEDANGNPNREAPVTLNIPDSWGPVSVSWLGGNWTGTNVVEGLIEAGSTFEVAAPVTANNETIGTIGLTYTILTMPSGDDNGTVKIYRSDETGYSANVACSAFIPATGHTDEEIGTLAIPSTVTYGEGDEAMTFDVVAIGEYAFGGLDWDTFEEFSCPNVTTVVIPASIQAIENDAFEVSESFMGGDGLTGFTNLQTVVFEGDPVEEDGAFWLTAALVVPATDEWKKLEDFTEHWNIGYNNASNEWAGEWTSISYAISAKVEDDSNEDVTINLALNPTTEEVVITSVENGESATGTVVIPQTITDGESEYAVTGIGDNAFEGQTNLTGVTLPKTVTSIGAEAFAGCTNMTSLTLQSPFAPTVGEGAFTGTCANLTVNYPAAAYTNYYEAGWTGVATFQPTVMQPNEWSTICSTQDFTLPEGIEAYIVVGIDYENCAVQVKAVEGIKAGVPMMIRKMGTDEDYAVTASNITITDTGDQLATTVGDDDAFIGYAPASANADPMEIPDVSGSSNMQAYILIDGTFVKWTSGTLAPYRCFLWATQAFNTGNAPQMGIEIVGDETTGVGLTPTLSNREGDWYDLSGRRLQSKPTQKGVYIINGKKVNVK